MPLTKTESRIVFWMDWTWDRTEEGLLHLRFYWYCAQFGTLVVMPMVVKRYGWGHACYLAVYLMNWRYVYDERHSWKGTDAEPVSAVDLIITLRAEHRDRQEAWRYRQGTPLSPLTDRLPDYWTNKPPLPLPGELWDPQVQNPQVITAELYLWMNEDERTSA